MLGLFGIFKFIQVYKNNLWNTLSRKTAQQEGRTNNDNEDVGEKMHLTQVEEYEYLFISTESVTLKTNYKEEGFEDLDYLEPDIFTD